MNNEKIFPEVDKNSIKSGILVGNQREVLYYPIIFKYLKNVLNGWRIVDFFMKIGKKKVALYAMTEFTDLILDDFSNSSSMDYIEGIYDRNSINLNKKYRGIELNNVDTMLRNMKENKIDCILICSFNNENAILNELVEKKKVDRHMIFSISEILFMV